MTERSHRLADAGRNFLALGFGNYGAMVVGLGVNVLLTRRLGTEGYGRLALMLMASQVLLLVTTNWTYAGFVRFASREFSSSRAVGATLWARLGIVIPAAALGILVMVFARERLAVYLDVPPIGISFILLHFSAISALALIGAVFQATDQMARYGACLFLDKAVMLVCIVALPASGSASPIVVLACYAASSMSVAIWGVWRAGLPVLRPGLPVRPAFRQMIAFSAPVLLSTWAGFLGANWFDLMILRWYVPVSSIGVYSLATQLAGMVQQITVIFSTLALPSLSVMLAEGQDARIKMFVERLVPYWLLGTSLLFSIVVLGASAGIPFVFGQSFGDAAPILVLLMVATSALALFNSFAPLIAAYGSMWALTGICLMSATANVVLDLLLIPPFGVLGSAVATILAYGTSAVLIVMFVRRRIGGRVLRLAWLSAPVLISCICFMVLDGVWFYMVTPVAAGITTIALVKAFRLFHKDDAVFLNDLRLPLLSRHRAG
jgi:O-antigen/teichoic acid export membrane protein